MTWVAVAVGGAAVVGGLVSSSNASKAANAQTSAAAQADATQLQMYNQTRTDQTPWRNAGGQAIGALSSYYGLPTTNADGTTTPGNPNAGAADTAMIQQMPGYQFNLQQGEQSTQRDLAARGLLGSGAAGKALTQYGQGYAMNASNQYLNGLQSIAGIGQTSVQSTGQAGMNAANQIGSNQIYAGNAQASGYANQSNAINAGLSGLGGAYGRYGGGGQQQPSSGYGTNPGQYTIGGGSGGSWDGPVLDYTGP
jgi:hypothetical protein